MVRCGEKCNNNITCYEIVYDVYWKAFALFVLLSLLLYWMYFILWMYPMFWYNNNISSSSSSSNKLVLISEMGLDWWHSPLYSNDKESTRKRKSFKISHFELNVVLPTKVKLWICNVFAMYALTWSQLLLNNIHLFNIIIINIDE